MEKTSISWSDFALWLSLTCVVLAMGLFVHGALNNSREFFQLGTGACVVAFALLAIRLTTILKLSYNPLRHDYPENVAKAKLLGGRRGLRRDRNITLAFLVFSIVVMIMLNIK